MPVLKNQRHELFAQAIATGVSGPDAYIAAGYDVASAVASASASRLLNDVKIGARIKELLDRGAQKAVKVVALNRGWVLNRLMAHADACLGLETVKSVRMLKSRTKDEAGGFQDEVKTVEIEVTERDAAAANRALELLGREVEGAPLFVERKEVGRPGDFDDRSDDELIEQFEALTGGKAGSRAHIGRARPSRGSKTLQ